ncbi:branched-chain amino acid ABC transporter permease [Limnohabitans sp. Rim8]|uniref:branched-chain amino acid ABC transporter permease n=1 Tax=Limnohabitans sp. Rim8 TaxID=1100718 RepID=UPI00260F88B3|nr:branched-chain amino acid ABC transporter permease [Limnohabitans sp. Rim8]
MRRFFTKPLMFSLAAVAVALALPHAFKTPYYIHLMTLALIWIVLAQGQNLTQGFVGYVSIAQAGFMGIGAYISTLLTMNFGVSVWATLVIAPLLTGAMAIIAGYPSLRVKGHYFSIVTLAYNMVIFIVLMTFKALTGGEAGIPDVPRPSELTLFGYVFSFEGRSNLNYYALALSAAILATACCALVLHSRAGRVMLAIRQNEDLAEAMGVVTSRYKLFAFVMSSIFAGLAGTLYAHYIGFLNPEPFGVDQSLNIILAVILGGSGTLTGPIVGAVSVVFLPELLRFADSFRLIIYGSILVIATIFLPKGLVPLVVTIWQRLRTRKTVAEDNKAASKA